MSTNNAIADHMQQDAPPNATPNMAMQNQQSGLDTLADVAERDIGNHTHPPAYENDARCQLGGEKSSTSASQQGLIVTSNGQKSWECAACGISFPKSKLLASHARETKHKAYRCSRYPTCTKAFGMRTAASRHEADHSAWGKHACSKCGTRFFHRRDHGLEHMAICVASLPLPTARRGPIQAMDVEPNASMSAARDGQYINTNADDVSTAFATNDYQRHLNTIAPDRPSLRSHLRDFGLSRPLSADLHNRCPIRGSPSRTTSMMASSGSQMPPTPKYASRDTQQVIGPHKTSVLQRAYEPHESADLYTCTYHGCTQRFNGLFERRKHFQDHHQAHPIETDRRDHDINPAPLHVAPADSQKRAQSYPCHSCPKLFTRAYTLREHLRTHTDERPFVCTVCGKAFARQHDRKRHENLHQGVRDFVCKGLLESGAAWGCGRTFARAEALDRHSRSKSGRICLELIYDEEATRREEGWIKELEKMQGATTSSSPLHLADIDWSSLSQHPPPYEEAYVVRSVSTASNPAPTYDRPVSEVSRSNSPDPEWIADYGHKNTDRSWSCAWPGCTSPVRFSQPEVLRRHYEKVHSRPLS